jgi:lipoprotein signal peptidase
MDRAMLGGVRDCIPVVIIWINLADVAIVAGLIGWAMTYQTTEGR